MEINNVIQSNEEKIFIKYLINNSTFPNEIKFKMNKYNVKIIYLNIIVIYYILCFMYKNENKNQMNTKNNNSFIYNHSEMHSFYDSLLIKYKRTNITWPLPNEIKFKPLMSNYELKEFCYLMNPKNVYFEFGSGGSTNIASYYKVKTYSVESDIKWHEKLKTNGITAIYITIDLNVSSSGYPGNNTNINDWKKYIQSYKKEYNADIILIDGRFRVACALDIFSKIRNDTIIIIHDYGYRNQYHIIEKFYIKIKEWDSLAVFVKNPNIISIPLHLYNYYINEKLI